MSENSLIDIKTGKCNFDGVVINPDFKFEDFIKYGDRAIIFKPSDTIGHIMLRDAVISNGIAGEIVLRLNLQYEKRTIEIHPHGRTNATDAIELDKMWLSGVIPAEDMIYIPGRMITAKYNWGYISGAYCDDPHYGKIGGDINIIYNRIPQ